MWRSRRHRALYRTRSTATAAGLLLVLPVACVVVALIPGKAQLWGAILILPALALAWRGAVVGVSVDEAGAKVAGILVSRHFAWSDIERFEVAPSGNAPFAGWLVLNHVGRRVPIMALSANGRSDGARRQVQEQVDALNAELAKSRGSRVTQQ